MEDPSTNTAKLSSRSDKQKDASVEKSRQLHNNINDTLKEQRARGPVHAFSPEMSPEQKKAEVMRNTNIPKIEITTDNIFTTNKDKSTLEQTERLFLKKDDLTIQQVTNATNVKAPGSYIAEPLIKNTTVWYNNMPKAPVIVGGNGTTSCAVNSHDTVNQFIKDNCFGDWFQNGGVVLVTVLATWILSKTRFGALSCVIVGAFFTTYYRKYIKRFRRNVRYDMQRVVNVNRLENTAETAKWLNYFLQRFWLMFEPALSAQIIGQADAILSENTPPFLDSIRLSTFTLGTKAPSLDGVKVYPSSAPDEICVDCKFSFVPDDVSDLTAREAKQRVEPKIVLTIRVGSSMIGAGMPVLLEDLAFSGHLRIKLKLFNEMPHVKSVEACFLEKPKFDYALKPVGGETFGFDINNIPGLESFVKDQVHSNLGHMMYAPNKLVIDVPSLMNKKDTESANGVLAVTVYSANNLKQSVTSLGSLNPYCTFHVSNVNTPELTRTTTIKNSSNPKWNETCFVLLNNMEDMLCFRVMDQNSGSDSEVGQAILNLKDLQESNYSLKDLSLVLLRNGKQVGEIRADANWYPVSVAHTEEDGTVVPAVESDSGVVRFYIHECKDVGQAIMQQKSGIPFMKNLPGVGKFPVIGSAGHDINAYAILKVNGQEKLRTAPFKRSVNPRWNKYAEFFVEDKNNVDFNVTILNSILGEDKPMGRWTSSLMDMENQVINEKNEWWNLQDGTGKIHLKMDWKPIPLTNFASGLTRGSYRPPIGVVRIKLNKATDLKNVEALTGGKSDPYVRVMSGLQVRGRTEAVLDNLNPVWDTALYVPIHSIREDLTLEVMDYNELQSDKFLGMTELISKDIVQEKKIESEQNAFEPRSLVKRNVDLKTKEGKAAKGKLEYEASFFATMALAKAFTVSENEGDAEAETKSADANAEDNEEESNMDSSTKITPDEAPTHDLHGEPIQITEDGKINLMAYTAGVLSVMVHDIVLPSKVKAVVDVMLDSNDAQFTTTPVKGKILQYNESGDAFVRELDLSRLIVSVREAEDKGKRFGFWTSPVQDIVKNIQKQSTTAKGKSEVEEYRLLECVEGKIRLSFRYIPVVHFRLDPQDSLENQGSLTVQLISASGLKSVDRNGKSDPYCKFSLNGERVYKTQVYKKTLSPVFRDEVFTVPVSSRTSAALKVKIYDWDQIGSHELLAEGTIPIATLESFATKEIDVQLNGAVLKLRLKWEPQLLIRKYDGTSLLNTTTGLAFDVVGFGVGAGGKVLTGGSRLVGGSLSAIGRGINKLGGNSRESSVSSR
ncbi:hypothetical protein BDF20DRAFT_713293 [Mycotypha africana]|uniref:uncharacterized protein n=1 Tax=Mycotypha africana TaxID=64632 RepID=UPI002301E6E1|nr:uncharacterized protein BDF20DRAFT_713293 [Mycotypha africana]KAI8971981.1 hypothetical protein BDF20DRAFT_713293 [Mycotypha africana]